MARTASLPFPTLPPADRTGKDGGDKGIRTPDLLIANETLYQLSYIPGSLPHEAWQVISGRSIWN